MTCCFELNICNDQSVFELAGKDSSPLIKIEKNLSLLIKSEKSQFVNVSSHYYAQGCEMRQLPVDFTAF